ncbi:hypothetical protein PILCRDRAFT_370242 [Piloderma croceum F 1598]|uniref:Fungal N-terminal domain-containing protein n=1 Tax=Piloderma croceum (strain F 1598) TaxID=765440 RepID=A0A0C3G2H1_PILCF|nr:hypothetical protein PILCRDRAFT_370242 [Piloderma croceum F 1598]
MAEALGVTGELPYHPNIDVAAHHHHSASVIGILQVTGTVICICYDYQSGVRNAPRDLDRITNQLIGLRAVLENLLTLARTEDMSGLSRLSTLALLIEPDGLLCKCKLEMERLKSSLEPAGGWRKVGQALTWPLKEGDVKKTHNYLQQTTATLQLALTADQTTLALVIHDGVACIQDNMVGLRADIDALEMDELRQKIYRWLLAPDPSSNHNEACMKRQPATGTWFINGDAFINWKMHSNSSLWLYGIRAFTSPVILIWFLIDIQQRGAENQFCVQPSFKKFYVTVQ